MKSNQKPESKTNSKNRFKTKLKAASDKKSKIFTKKSNTNKKKASETSTQNEKSSTSIFKKNEFVLILLGGLLLTIIIFFFFFRSSDSNPGIVKQNFSNSSFVDFEKRIQDIEKALQIEDKSDPDSVQTNQTLDQNHINDRLSRLETAFAVKFDSLIDRMGQIEKNILQLKNNQSGKPVKKTVNKKSQSKIVVPVKEPVKKLTKNPVKQKNLFHTVKKKETLYSISKQYNTNIEKLRELNKLSKSAKIYPGDNLLVR